MMIVCVAHVGDPGKITRMAYLLTRLKNGGPDGLPDDKAQAPAGFGQGSAASPAHDQIGDREPNLLVRPLLQCRDVDEVPQRAHLAQHQDRHQMSLLLDGQLDEACKGCTTTNLSALCQNRQDRHQIRLLLDGQLNKACIMARL